MDEDYDTRAHNAMVRDMVQLTSPSRCREAHPHDDTAECTLARAHQQVDRTPHRDGNGTEWFAVLCLCMIDSRREEPCGECGGSRRVLIDSLPPDTASLYTRSTDE